LPKSSTGTLDNPIIREEGRKFLADLLVQLTDVQLHDLFEAARFPRPRRPEIRRAATRRVSRSEASARICLIATVSDA